MKIDLKIRKVTQDVLKFLCFKHRIITEELSNDLRFSPEITPQLMNNICNATWVQTLYNDFVWSGFFQKHFQRMTSSPEMFTKYVSFACYTFLDGITDEYTMVFDTLTIVTYFGIRCWEEGSKQYLNTCVDLFCAMYEKEFRSQFESQGGFENFNEYIEEQINDRDLSALFNAKIHSFEQFTQLEKASLHKRAFKHYNEVLQNRDQTEVETDENVVRFSKSVAGKIGELCQKTFDQILIGFVRTDIQVKEMYRQMFGGAAGELSSESDPTLPRKVKEETLKKTREQADIQELVRQNFCKMVKLHKLDTHDADVQIKASSHLSPKSEKLRKLLDDISADYSRLYEIIQTLCEQHEVLFPVPMEAETKI